MREPCVVPLSCTLLIYLMCRSKYVFLLDVLPLTAHACGCFCWLRQKAALFLYSNCLRCGRMKGKRLCISCLRLFCLLTLYTRRTHRQGVSKTKTERKPTSWEEIQSDNGKTHGGKRTMKRKRYFVFMVKNFDYAKLDYYSSLSISKLTWCISSTSSYAPTFQEYFLIIYPTSDLILSALI